jgi:hypothetical protein
MSQFKHPHSCWICGNEVDLKTCYTDENGAAVHENCYLVKLALATESMKLIIRKPAIRIRRTDGALQNRGSCTR